MKNLVSIKGTPSGIILVLDSDGDFDAIREETAKKFASSAEFFGENTRGILFRGRVISEEEQQILIDTIEENSKLRIACIIEENAGVEAAFTRGVEAKYIEQQKDTGLFHKGSLRSGQVLEVGASIVVLGDVNPGAKIVSAGNVIVLGSLRGNVFAGSTGNMDAFVVALDMDPMQIRIGDAIARSPDKKEPRWKRKKDTEAKIAFWEDGNIYIEPLGKEVLADIRLSK